MTSIVRGKRLISIFLVGLFGLTACKQQIQSIEIGNRGTPSSIRANQNGYTPLHLAVLHGRNAIVTGLLVNKAIDVNKKDSRGMTPLHYAVQLPDHREREAMVALLLANARVDVNAQNQNGDTPLHCAIALHHEEVVTLLLADVRIDVNIENRDNYTTLDWLILRRLYMVAQRCHGIAAFTLACFLWR